MSDQERPHGMKADMENQSMDQGAANSPHSTRKRKTKAEKIEALNQEILKHQQKIEQLKAQKDRAELTPEQKKELKRKTENHCKIIAGVAALELCKLGNESFTIDNFKKMLYSKLNAPLEISYLDKQFKEKS